MSFDTCYCFVTVFKTAAHSSLAFWPTLSPRKQEIYAIICAPKNTYGW